ncbi:UNVERIFIED_CONTAM: hypothetical protein Slati_4259000 [Sesamum latifolium]|uniref:Uncharacterized protein n=1 Tax=Sesamum latifolium TaxID=2727402 RepID=A0AAW2TC26_9LAMI
MARLDKNLGLLAVGGRSHGQLFGSIRECIAYHIIGWNTKLLLQAGKGVLITSVIQAMPTYVMSCFRLSLFFLRSIESSVADFWWHCRESDGYTGWRGGNCVGQRKRGGSNFAAFGSSI